MDCRAGGFREKWLRAEEKKVAREGEPLHVRSLAQESCWRGQAATSGLRGEGRAGPRS
jgi:hypothetical protein